jgi:tRNA-Thr(GGU) m(6)t(6)A37 methyltransferase TsaA
MDEILFKPIGIVHSPLKQPQGTPIQSLAGKDINGSIEVFSEYTDGLKDLEGFSHIILFYYFHLVKKTSLIAKPFLDDKSHGIFSIRGPCRPNPLGFSIVRLINIERSILHIKDLDVLDGTPLLDIKPYVPEFDKRENTRIGWMEKNISKLSSCTDDGRFIK